MISEQLQEIKSSLPSHVTLIAVSKTHPAEKIDEAYKTGHRDFGENKVQELLSKKDLLPADVQWHLIGHLQTNKVKYIVPFVHLIHAVDSMKLLSEINKQAKKTDRVVNCLLQVYIAKEETKFGMDFTEVESLLSSQEFSEMKNIQVKGLMGMATNTFDENIVRNEFRSLKVFFETLKTKLAFDTLSMGMSSDYKIAIQEGSTMIRVGSAIFGERDYDL